MSYHTRDIEKGIIGEFSKIKEEFEEAEDAVKQGDSILTICELSDMVGAIEEYIKRWNLDLISLKQFSDKTKSAFREGKRK